MSEADVARRIEARLRDQGLIPEEPPPWSYFQKGRGKMFCWTTAPDFPACIMCEGEGTMPWGDTCDRCDGDGKEPKGWYFSFTYAPAGKGSRSGAAEEWRFVDSSLRNHRKRKDAKARAEKLYDKEKP
jgi:hypothetical protein